MSGLVAAYRGIACVHRHAPLGVAIGGETPEEIAISIIAEIIRERRTKARDEFTLGVRFGRLKRST